MDSNLGEEGMDEGDEDNDSNGNAAFLPLCGDSAGGDDDVGSKDDASRSYTIKQGNASASFVVGMSGRLGHVGVLLTCEAKRNGLYGKDNSDEPLGPRVRSLEVDLFAAAARNHAGKLEPNAESSQGEQQAENPQEHGGSHAADAVDN